MKDYSQNLGYWVKRYAILANQAMENTLQPYGIGRTQWYILFHISHEGEMPQRKLQTVLEVESATLTVLVSSLVKKGLVVQQRSPTDKRGKQLALTEAGKHLWRHLPDPIEVVKAQALEGIAIKDIQAARATLQAAVRNLERNE